MLEVDALIAQNSWYFINNLPRSTIRSERPTTHRRTLPLGLIVHRCIVSADTGDKRELEGLETVGATIGGRIVAPLPYLPGGGSISFQESVLVGVDDQGNPRFGFQVTFGGGVGLGNAATVGGGGVFFPTVDVPSQLEGLGSEEGTVAGQFFAFRTSSATSSRLLPRSRCNFISPDW